MSKVPYASTVHSNTRLDIAIAGRVVSRYMSNLGKQHWEVICVFALL